MAWLAADIQTSPALHPSSPAPQEFYNKPLPGLFQLLSHSGCPRSSWLLGLLPFHKGNGLRAGEGRSQALSCPQAGRQGRVGTRDSPVPQNRKDQDPCFTADPHTLTSLSGSLASLGSLFQDLVAACPFCLSFRCLWVPGIALSHLIGPGQARTPSLSAGLMGPVRIPIVQMTKLRLKEVK